MIITLLTITDRQTQLVRLEIIRDTAGVVFWVYEHQENIRVPLYWRPQ